MSDDSLPKGIIRSRERGPSLPGNRFAVPVLPSPAAGEGQGVGASWGKRETPRITALETQEKRDGRVSVFVDGKFAIGLFKEVAAALGLRVGQAITPERLGEMAKAETQARAREDAYRLLSYRDRSEQEMTERLTQKGYEPDVVTETIAHLHAVGYLNDASFARRWAETRGATRGKRALAFELRRKGIDGETAGQALDATRTDEGERDAARTAAVRKVGERPADQSREAKARLAAFLQRRGFGWETVRPVLAELYGHATDEESEDGEGTEIPEESER